MPIVDVHAVVSASCKLPDDAAQRLAASIAGVLNAETGTVWVRLAEIADGKYAENGANVEDNNLPVFIQVMHADWSTQHARAREAAALAAAVAACLGRLVDRIHVEFAPPGRGRIAFGGKLVV
jgi:phenylpyruvate tautomerase PptA (4-oxalocrotonate tautomerase family)